MARASPIALAGGAGGAFRLAGPGRAPACSRNPARRGRPQGGRRVRRPADGPDDSRARPGGFRATAVHSVSPPTPDPASPRHPCRRMAVRPRPEAAVPAIDGSGAGDRGLLSLVCGGRPAWLRAQRLANATRCGPATAGSGRRPGHCHRAVANAEPRLPGVRHPDASDAVVALAVPGRRRTLREASAMARDAAPPGSAPGGAAPPLPGPARAPRSGLRTEANGPGPCPGRGTMRGRSFSDSTGM